MAVAHWAARRSAAQQLSSRLDRLDARVCSRWPGGVDDGRNSGSAQITRSLRVPLRRVNNCRRGANRGLVARRGALSQRTATVPMTVFVSAQAGVNLHAAWENVGRVRRGADVEAEDRAAAEPGRLPAVQPAYLTASHIPDRGARLPGVVRRIRADVRARQAGAAGAGDPAGGGDDAGRRGGLSDPSPGVCVARYHAGARRGGRCWRWRPECGSGPSWPARPRVRC